jgi:two-component system OmpR family response regulator
VSDVVVLCWPSDADDVVRLHDHGVPCLLLVDAAADPPDLSSLLVDWVRLPADDRDLTARLCRLRRHAVAPAVLPTLDGYGRLAFGDRWVELTPIEERLAEALIESFSTVVPGPALVARGWPGAPPSTNALRIHLHRLRRRIEPIGLEVRMLRGSGYLLRIADGPTGTREVCAERATSGAFSTHFVAQAQPAPASCAAANASPLLMNESAAAAASGWRRSSS